MSTVDLFGGGVWGRTFRALRQRNFRLFFAGQFLSLIGTWMQSLAQGWLVWRLSHSSYLLGVVAFCQMAPVLFLALLGGVAADRFNRHKVVLATQTALLLQATVMAGLTLAGWIQVWHVMVLAAVLGSVNAFDMPGRQAFLVQMVGREDLGNAIALNSTIFNGARIIGPAIAGFVVNLWGEGACFAINAVSYLAVLVGLLAMRLPKHSGHGGEAGAWARIREGLGYAWRAHHVRALLALMVVVGFLGLPYLSFLPAIAGGVFHTGAHGLGVLMTCVGVGALASAVLFANRQGVTGLGPVAPFSAIGFGVALVLFAFSRSFAFSCLLVSVAGFGLMMQMACTNTLLQSLVPDRLRGRLMSLYTLSFIGMTPLGSLLMGRLTPVFGVQEVIGAGGALVVLAGVLFAVPLPRAVARAQAAAR